MTAHSGGGVPGPFAGGDGILWFAAVLLASVTRGRHPPLSGPFVESFEFWGDGFVVGGVSAGDVPPGLGETVGATASVGCVQGGSVEVLGGGGDNQASVGGPCGERPVAGGGGELGEL